MLNTIYSHEEESKPVLRRFFNELVASLSRPTNIMVDDVAAIRYILGRSKVADLWPIFEGQTKIASIDAIISWAIEASSASHNDYESIKLLADWVRDPKNSNGLSSSTVFDLAMRFTDFEQQQQQKKTPVQQQPQQQVPLSNTQVVSTLPHGTAGSFMIS
jgi:hypothetical protein